MAIELSKEDRAQAIASIERYFLDNFEQKSATSPPAPCSALFWKKSAPAFTTAP
jgi:hypothetical protein